MDPDISHMAPGHRIMDWSLAAAAGRRSPYTPPPLVGPAPVDGAARISAIRSVSRHDR